MDDILKDFFTALIRTGGGMVFAWLIAKGLLTEAQAAQVAMFGGTFIAVMLWSLWNKYKVNQTIDTALHLPAGTTRKQLKAKIKELKKL